MPNGQLPDSKQVRLKLVSCKPTTYNSLTYSINHTSQDVPSLCEHGPIQDQDPKLISVRKRRSHQHEVTLQLRWVLALQFWNSRLPSIQQAIFARGLQPRLGPSRVSQSFSFLPASFCKGCHFENGSLLGEAQQRHGQVRDGDDEAWKQKDG